MSFDAALAHKFLEEHYGSLPHPEAAAIGVHIPVRDYPAFARAATARYDHPPEPSEVATMHEELRQNQLSPADFERLWRVARPLANRLLDRDPEIGELARLQDAHPGDIHAFYMEHPDPDYPEVSAGDLLRYHHAATPIAQKLVGREPNKLEAARFAIAGYDADAMVRHYSGWGEE